MSPQTAQALLLGLANEAVSGRTREVVSLEPRNRRRCRIAAPSAGRALYPAMTRGTDMNVAFVFTTPVRAADPQPGTRPAPELGRYDRLRREHAGYPPGLPGTAVPGALGLREPVAVLADVLGRDGAETSATQTRQRNLANADHLGVLHAIWTAETTAARDDRYRDLVLAALPAADRQDLSGQARWLFRTLRGAELAGLDPAESPADRHRLPRPGRSPGHRRGPGRPDPPAASTRCCPRPARLLGQPHPQAA